MPQYLITFPSNAMDHIPEQEMPEVARAAHAVCQEAINPGVYVLAGGMEDQPASFVAPEGTVTDGPKTGRHQRNHDRGRAVTGGGAEVGRQSRCRVPLYAGGPGVRIRPELDAMLREAAG